jgi:Flp pilus assembly protein TadG
MRRLRDPVKRFGRSERGAAAAEFALWLSLLTPIVMNVIDIGFFAYQRIQVETAAHAAVNSAWHDCNPTNLTPAAPPAITTCKGVVTAVITDMQNAAQSTALGGSVGLATSDISEGYYCASGSGTLTLVTSIGTAASPPSSNPTVPTCSGSSTFAGDYIVATVRYTYAPVFSGVSVLSYLPTAVARTAYMRLDG